MDQSQLHKIRDEINKAKLVVFLGGAGVSTSSGIPDFRSKDGLYRIKNKYGVSYEEMLSHAYFFEHTSSFYSFFFETMVNEKAQPNKAHFALANFERKHGNFVVVTQNIDGLHQKAGSQNVLEVHGSYQRYHCLSCGKHFSLSDIPHSGMPHCPSCGGLIKPGVVLYGEGLPEDVLSAAFDAVRKADVLIVGGTSLMVYPIASLPGYFRGGCKILINRDPTPQDDEFDYIFHEDIGDTLSLILGEEDA